jgi:hypothetical protein
MVVMVMVVINQLDITPRRARRLFQARGVVGPHYGDGILDWREQFRIRGGLLHLRGAEARGVCGLRRSQSGRPSNCA